MKILVLFLIVATPALAEAPLIKVVAAAQTGTNWRFDVTLRHPDSGWGHYADGWRIETADGTILGTRLLTHPHVSEQPFTRSLSGVAIPTATAVYVRAKCLLDGWSDETHLVTLD